MLYDGYDGLREKVVNQTDRMIATNSIDNLSLGYKKSKEFLMDAYDWKRKKYDTSNFIDDIERCEKYCSIIDSLKWAKTE